MSTTFTASELNDVIPSLQRFAVSLTRNEDQAHDLVQDSIERALRKSNLYKPGTNFRPWMFTLCKRLFLNQIRKHKSQGKFVDLGSAPQTNLSRPSDQEKMLECKEMLRFCDKLPARDRTVMYFIAVEGMKYEEVAAFLDVPVGTIRSRLSRARTRLKEMMETGAAPLRRAV